MEENLPPGFRFHPTDEELIIYYLTKKVTEFGFATRAIADVDLNKCEPWDLPGKASMGEKEWYFYSMKDRKYPTGLRTNRATDSGYWKTTGKDKEIFHGGVLVGMKKTLVFYKGRAPKGEKTCWVMHEYRLHTRFPYKPTKEEWVVCRVFRKSNVNNGAKKQQPDSPASPAMPALLLESPCNTTSVLSDLDVSVLSNLVNASSYDGMQTRESVINKSNRLDMNMYMSWVLAREATCQPSLPWGSGRPGLMAPTPLALQPQGINDIASLSSFVARQGGDDHALYGNDSRLSFFPASSSKGVECAQQQQIQSLNQESLWRGH